MELMKELKGKMEKAESKEEAKNAIEDAAMIHSDDELDQVAGGEDWNPPGKNTIYYFK